MRGGDQGEVQGGVLKWVLKGLWKSRGSSRGSKGSREDLGQIQGRSMRSGMSVTRGGGVKGRTRGCLGVKECLGVPREVLGENITVEAYKNTCMFSFIS